MPILRMEEIREMSIEDRENKLQEIYVELMKLNTMIKAGGAIESPGRKSLLKKTIARILTVINEEE